MSHQYITKNKSGQLAAEVFYEKDIGTAGIKIYLNRSKMNCRILTVTSDHTIDPDRPYSVSTEIRNPDFVRIDLDRDYDILEFVNMMERICKYLRNQIKEKHSENASSPTDWAKKVKKRDGKCMKCGTTENLEAHHIENRNYADEFSLSLANGITLCAQHHKEFHQKYGKERNYGLQIDEFINDVWYRRITSGKDVDVDYNYVKDGENKHLHFWLSSSPNVQGNKEDLEE